MAEITLNAKYCWIDTTPENLEKNYGDFGIYILGIKNSQGRIVPYYVGKYETLIGKRVLKHIDDIGSNCTTYTIFSDSFLRSRGINLDFIQRVAKPSQKYPEKSYLNDILYLNERKFFQKLWLKDNVLQNVAKKWPSKPFPLYLMNFSGYTKELDAVNNARKSAYCPGSLFFTTITFDKSNLGTMKKEQMQKLLACIETYVKFSLKINTIGESQTLITMNDNLSGIKISIDFTNMSAILQSEFYSSPR